MPYVIDDPVFVLKGLGRLAVGAFIDESDFEAFVQERHHLQSFQHRLGAELDLIEDGRIRPEADGGSGASLGCSTHDLQLALGPASVDELEQVVVAIPIDFEKETGGEGIHHRHSDSMEATGDLVAAPLTELAPGMENCQHHFGGRAPLVFRHRSGWYAPAIITDPDASVGQQRDDDTGAVAGHGLVDRVVHDLPHQVVETGRTGGPDVHPRSLPDRIEALQNSNVLGAVAVLRHCALVL